MKAGLNRLITRVKTGLNDRSYHRVRGEFTPPGAELSLKEIKQRYPSPNLQHLYCRWLFDHRLPAELRQHREFYAQARRGFGEDEFHAMWYSLFKELRPRRVLEIGVYRGQVITLWGILARQFNLDLAIHAISPFTNAGDHVSAYADIDYFADVSANLARFGVTSAILHKGYSTDPAMVAVIQSQPWDIIYIDGCHDYDVVVQDFAACAKAIAPQGLIVLDDSALYSDFTPPRTSFAGQPGPSRLARELDPALYEEVIAVGHNRVWRKTKVAGRS